MTTIQIRIIILSLVVLLCTLHACKPTPDYKAIRQQVMDRHDELMGDDDRAMSNKMRLDTLAMPAGMQKLKQAQPQLDTAAERQHINALIKQLDSADDAMNDWMHNFSADVQGKSNEIAVRYFEAEKIKVAKLDSAYKAVIKASDEELNKFHIKAATTKQPAMKM